ncbi:MAG: hypothetical protein ACD_23C00949G0001 [uncultured bacterium]|nr:MAG: hypothetical protein ACD_23C00949G0001 [uncultured bacterium]
MSASIIDAGDLPQCLVVKSRNNMNVSRYAATVQGLSALCWVMYSAKNACISAGNDGGAGVTFLLVITSLRRLCILLKLGTSQRHELRNAGEIPVGFGNLGVPQIG